MQIDYQWKGPEEPLGMTTVTAVHMGVSEIADGGALLSARGTFTFRDHTEGCDGTSKWFAMGTCEKGKFEWTIHCEDQPSSVFKDAEGRETFCLIDEVNQAIKAFIGQKLTRVFIYAREHTDQEISLIDGPQIYTGPMTDYTGPCVCEKIGSSSNANLFDWNTHTDGGKYAANCFKCSCGNRWYLGNPEEAAWLRVNDDDTWNMLARHNGIITELVGLDPESPNPVLVLTRKLRERGLTLIG